MELTQADSLTRIGHIPARAVIRLDQPSGSVAGQRGQNINAALRFLERTDNNGFLSKLGIKAGNQGSLYRVGRSSHINQAGRNEIIRNYSKLLKIQKKTKGK